MLAFAQESASFGNRLIGTHAKSIVRTVVILSRIESGRIRQIGLVADFRSIYSTPPFCSALLHGLRRLFVL